MSTPKVSVVMPAYNSEKYISAAINSILSQSFKNFELLIIDDGSTDSTWEIIDSFAKKDNRVVPVRNEVNLKICKTLNKGVNIAKGEYIARMDADDWSYPERIGLQANYLGSHEDVVIVGGAIEICDENMQILNTRKYELDDIKIRKKLIRYSQFAHPAVMYRTEAVKLVGGYNPDVLDAEDYDLYFRLGTVGKFGNLGDTLLKLRTHSGSISYGKVGRQSWMTLGIKLKAIFVLGYKIGLLDIAHLVFHFLGNILVPSRIKFKAFNLYRTLVTK